MFGMSVDWFVFVMPLTHDAPIQCCGMHHYIISTSIVARYQRLFCESSTIATIKLTVMFLYLCNPTFSDSREMRTRFRENIFLRTVYHKSLG
jgi:hypothetical protein